MSRSTPRRARPPSETSGSQQRPARRLAAPALSFDLASEAASLKQEAAWESGDRNARTLVLEPGFRIVLTVMKAGTRLREHRAVARASILALAGRLRLHLPAQTIDLPADHLLTLEPGLMHDVEALEESAFLLTISG